MTKTISLPVMAPCGCGFLAQLDSNAGPISFSCEHHEYLLRLIPSHPPGQPACMLEEWHIGRSNVG